MKKLFVLLVIMTGFMFTDLNAQSCCSIKKECKPKQCCPAIPNCCKSTKKISSTNENDSNGIAKQPKKFTSVEPIAVNTNTRITAIKED